MAKIEGDDVVKLPTRRTLLVIAAGALGGFAVCWVLAVLPWPALRHVDSGPPASGHAVSLRDPVVRIVAFVVTDLGSPIAVDIVTVLAVGYLALTRRWRPAVAVAVARLGELAGESVVKIVVGRPRPELLPVLTSASGPSFPSGHAAGSAAVYGVLAILVATAVRRRPARYVVAAASVFVVAVAVSRVLLGVHYPTDVLGGLALGATWAAAALVIVAARRSSESAL